MSITVQNNIVSLSPAEYAAAAVLANEVGEQMLARLEWVVLQPKVIVDVGCGVGHCAALLRERYPTANLIALDVAYPMLQYAKQQAKSSLHCVNADAVALPFRDRSVDLVFANLMLPWGVDLEKILREWRRVLRPNGLLMFTSFGPDTLRGWHEELASITMPHLVDMHDIGDILTRTKFADPVMDVDYITLTYRELDTLYQELQASGMIISTENPHRDQREKSQEKRLSNGLWSTTYEVVYGHAWGPDEIVDHVADEQGTVRIPLSHLRRRG